MGIGDPDPVPPGIDTAPFEGPFDDLTLPSDIRNGNGSKNGTGNRRDSTRRGPEDPKTTPPSVDEWNDFLSRVLIKGLMDHYLDFVFRDIDENALSDFELSQLYLSDDERSRIVKPLSELAYKMKWTRKHGRTILAASGSIDSLLTLGIWLSRVNKIAQRHQPTTGRVIHTEAETIYVSPEQATQNGASRGTESAEPPRFQQPWQGTGVWEGNPGTG